MGQKEMVEPCGIGPRWIEIDLDAIMHNVRSIKELLQPGTRLMAVVKADAYGCGAVDVSRAVLEAGAEMLGVTTIDEGMELREQGIEAPILVFAPLSVHEVEKVIEYGLTSSVDDPGILEAFSGMSRDAKVHLKVNTGMNRFGMEPSKALECLHQELSGVEVEGIYSHLATTTVTGKNFVREQCAVFMGMVSTMEQQGLTVPIKHICNSGAVLDMPEMHLDMVRVGNLLYGQYPFGYKGGKGLILRDPWKARARVVYIRQVHPGDTVGYGRDFRAKKETRVGIIPVGFADGLDVAPQFTPKNLIDLARMLLKTILSFFGKRAGTPLVTLGGRPLNIVGRIGMQVAAVDLSQCRQVQPGDTVEVFLRRTTASSRLPRVYLSQGRIRAVRTVSGYRTLQEEYSHNDGL